MKKMSSTDSINILASPLDKIPNHWKKVQVNQISTKITNGYVGPTRDILKDEGVRYLQSLHIKNNSIIFKTPYYVSEEWSQEKEKSILKKGDVLIVQTGDIGQSATVTEEFEGCNCHALIIVTPSEKNLKGEWLSWVLNSAYGKQTLSAIQTGALHPHLNCGNIKFIHIPLPPIKEQVALIAFINYETAKIDALIAEQERLIELLQEKRQAVISHAVTKGLNPDAPMKDSGVEWLGDVPEHWVGCRFKHCLMGLTDAEHKTCPDHEEGEYLIIRTSNIREGILITEGAKYTDANGYKEWTTRCTPQAGDVVFTREAPAGEACIIPEGVTACLGQRTVLMHPRLSKATPEFLVSSIYSGAAKTFIQNLSQGSTVSHLNMSEIGNMPIALPPLDEQLEINKFTKEKSRKFDDLIKQARASTKLLKERRSALISAAVTGQIDVRGLVPQEEAA